MLVIGLLTSKKEADELQFIAKVCTIEDRIRFIAQKEKYKKLMDDL